MMEQVYLTAEKRLTKSDRVKGLVEAIKKDPIERKGHVYHPIPFEEFTELTTSTNRHEAEKKLALTIETIETVRPEGVAGARILDVGARGGYHTFSLDHLGAHVTAFEPHPRYAQIGSVLAEEKAQSVTWHPTPLDFTLIDGKKFDVTLMLSVFQWMAAGGERMDEALNELRRISEISSAIVFELGFNQGLSALKIQRRNHYAHLIHMLKNNTQYRNFKRIGTIYAWKGAPRHMVIASNLPQVDDGLFLKFLRTLHI